MMWVFKIVNNVSTLSLRTTAIRAVASREAASHRAHMITNRSRICSCKIRQRAT